MRISTQHEQAVALLMERWPLLAPAHDLAAALRERHRDLAAQVADLDRALDDAGSLVATHGGFPVYQGLTAALQGWPTQEDIDREEARANFFSGLAARVDLALCILGTFVARCRYERASDPALRGPDVDRLMASHRDHREGERAHSLRRLENSARATADADAAKALRAEASRIRSIGERDLLCDRSAHRHGTPS